MLKNETGVHISLAVWLANDDYDHDPDPFTVSVTTLLKPIKAVILALRLTGGEGEADIKDVIKSSIGTAIHNDVEQVWRNKKKRDIALAKLGTPKKIIEAIVINPKPEDLKPGDIPVYMEVRSKRKLGKWTISGKFDFVIESIVSDFKSTGTYTYITQCNSEGYRQQGSIYRWLNPDIIVSDHMTIQYIFTDWKEMMAKTSKDYPQAQVMGQKFLAMSHEETEAFVKSKLAALELFINAEQQAMPACTRDELWQNDPVWKYYMNPANTKRSTKNFNNPTDANQRLIDDGSVGKVVEVAGLARRCHYCTAYPVCLQAENLVAQGLLKI